MTLSTTSREALVHAAIQAKEHAYFPHSHFRVGAALMCTDGTIVKGASVDNAAYGASMCAERTAIVSAISEGKHAFSALAVVSDVVTPISPCGLCRQVIREFCTVDMPVLLVPGNYLSWNVDERNVGNAPVVGDGKGRGDGVIEVTVGELLPYSYGPGKPGFERVDTRRRTT